MTRESDPSSADPCDAVVEVMREVAASAGKARVTLESPPSLMTDVGAATVSRVVSNLLTNAGKYAPVGPVQVTLGRHDLNGVRVEVSDHGPGLPVEEMEAVFDPFYRVADDHPQPGTGIGLAIVRELARLHGGEAWVEPSDAGLHVVVELVGGRRSTDGVSAVPRN